MFMTLTPSAGRHSDASSSPDGSASAGESRTVSSSCGGSSAGAGSSTKGSSATGSPALCSSVSGSSALGSSLGASSAFGSAASAVFPVLPSSCRLLAYAAILAYAASVEARFIWAHAAFICCMFMSRSFFLPCRLRVIVYSGRRPENGRSPSAGFSPSGQPYLLFK